MTPICVQLGFSGSAVHLQEVNLFVGGLKPLERRKVFRIVLFEKRILRVKNPYFWIGRLESKAGPRRGSHVLAFPEKNSVR